MPARTLPWICLLALGAGPQEPPAAPPQDAFKVDVGLVNLNVKVTDRTGRVLPDLGRDQFRVYEDGALQTITHFQPVTAPINLVLLLDLSGSTRKKLRLIKSAARRFVDALSPNDAIAVAAFTRRFRVVSPFTRGRRLLEERIGRLRNVGSGTAYYDAVWSALDLLDGVPDARRAIVVLTDGVDNSITNPERYETAHGFDALLARAAEEEATIYPIYLDTEYEIVVRRREDTHDSYVVARTQMAALAEQTGGTVFRAERFEDLDGVYGRVAAELRTLYSLAYASSNPRKDGRWRSVGGRPTTAGSVARARPGYYSR